MASDRAADPPRGRRGRSGDGHRGAGGAGAVVARLWSRRPGGGARASRRADPPAACRCELARAVRYAARQSGPRRCARCGVASPLAVQNLTSIDSCTPHAAMRVYMSIGSPSRPAESAMSRQLACSITAVRVCKSITATEIRRIRMRGRRNRRADGFQGSLREGAPSRGPLREGTVAPRVPRTTVRFPFRWIRARACRVRVPRDSVVVECRGDDDGICQADRDAVSA